MEVYAQSLMWRKRS